MPTIYDISLPIEHGLVSGQSANSITPQQEVSKVHANVSMFRSLSHATTWTRRSISRDGWVVRCRWTS